MLIADQENALQILRKISYYRMSAYWIPFKDKVSATEKFHNVTKFEDAVRLYEFDRGLRLLLLDGIERIEVFLRTQVTYVFGHKYGAFGHINADNFHKEFKHKKWLQK